MDREKLEAEMKKKKVNKKQICKELGISRSAFYRKCRGITQFTQEEIQHIVDFLNLESPVGIFFEEKVS